MAKPLYSYAIDQAVLSIGRYSPARSSGGYGHMPGFVALKTAHRVVEMGFATAHPRLGARTSRLQLTAAGADAFRKLGGAK